MDGRVPLPRLAAVLCAALALAAPAQVGVDTPHDPGPFAVGRTDWHFGSLAVSSPDGWTGTVSVDHFGTLRYPAVAPGEAMPVAPGGPFPLVVYAHGRFQAIPFMGQNHLQAEYLLDQLASWGFVVAAVNLDGVGMFAVPAGIPQRGEIILATLDAFEALDPEGLVLDMEHIGLVGHSRGGEGCLSALEQESPHAIAAVATIATTRFEELAPVGVPYLGLYGSKDGDVNDGWPIITYEEANGAIKAFEYVEGANHFWFTESIHYTYEGAADITREQHHEVVRAYVAAFLRATLRGEPELMPELADGMLMSPVTDDVAVHPMYSDPDAIHVDVYDSVTLDPSINSLGGVVASELLSAYWEGSLHWPLLTLYHPTAGAWLDYDTGGLATPLYVQSLGIGLDVSGHAAFSIRAVQHWGDPLNAMEQPQDLRVGLLDGSGQIAVRKLGAYGTIPYPVTHGSWKFPKKSVLRTTRIPLSEFLQSNPALDLTDLRYLGLIFDQSPSAALRIDDLEFTR